MRLTRFLLGTAAGAGGSGAALSRLRNIGIVAHIDAGKTSTTERLLNLAGATDAVGSVDRGDTVTDYLSQERERGITIVSAAVTFKWKSHQVTLIDTPGHVDFAFEVERALRALDAVAVVLDSSKGVQAQTVSVCRQARRLGLPMLVFLNKLDLLGAAAPRRVDAALRACLQSVAKQLGVTPALINRPLPDLSAVRCLLSDAAEPAVSVERLRLLEVATEVDEALADRVLALAPGADPLAEVSMATEVRPALVRATRSLRVAPVLCGSAKTGLGVPQLLDAVLQFLPPPPPPPLPQSGAEHPLAALAFKTMRDPRRGLLTFCRIYSGRLHANSSLYSCGSLGDDDRTSAAAAAPAAPEKCGRIYRPFADSFAELSSGAGPGQIVALSGLRSVGTGDILTDRPDAAAAAVAAASGQRRRLRPPDPVVFAAVEADSLAQVKPLEEALAWLALEDPGLRVRLDEETGQTVLCGLGELHLQVAAQRLREHLGPHAFRLGPVTVSYRERLVAPVTIESFCYRSEAHGAAIEVTLSLDLQPRDAESTDAEGVEADEADEADEPEVAFVSSGESQNYWGHLPPAVPRALRDGLAKGLRAGPLVRGHVTHCRARVRALSVARAGYPVASPARLAPQIASAAYSAVRRSLSAESVQLTEPLMRLRIDLAASATNPSAALDALLAELARRQCSIERLDRADDADESTSSAATLLATGSVAQLSGLPSAVRSATHGHADLHLELRGYRPVIDQAAAVRRIRFGV